MMAFLHGSGSVVYVAENDLSAYLNAATVSQSVQTHTEVTSFGSTAMKRFAGLADGSMTFNGVFDAAFDAIVAPYIGSAAGEPVTFGVGGGTTLGDRVRVCLAKHATYSSTAPVGGMIGVSVNIESDGGLDAGRILHVLSAETTTGNGSSIDDSASTAQGGVAVIHCTAASGTTPTLDAKVQDSPNDSTWADLATFTQLTAAGSERVVVAAGTTVDRYLRASWTVGGTTPSFTFALSFARRHRAI